MTFLFKVQSTLSGSHPQLFVAQGQEQCGVSGEDTLFPLAVEENTLLNLSKISYKNIPTIVEENTVSYNQKYPIR